MAEPTQWVSVADAAVAVRMSAPTVYGYVKRNEVEHQRRDGKTVVRLDDVKAMAAQRHARYPVPTTTIPHKPEEEIPVAAAPVHEEEPVSLSPAVDRLTQARAAVVMERNEIAASRSQLEAEIARLSGELELLTVRESELDDALKAIETVERLTGTGGD